MRALTALFIAIISLAMTTSTIAIIPLKIAFLFSSKVLIRGVI